jgi:hypothetical protein
MENEFIISGSNIETIISKHKGVGTVLATRGDVEVDNYQGVLSLKNKIGSIIINDASGSINIKKVTGSIDIDKFSGELKSEMRYGDLTLSNSSITKLSTKIESGEIVLDKVTDSKKIDLSLNSGEIVVTNSKIDRVSAFCGGGDITFKNVTANFDLDVKAGDIYLENSELILTRDNYIKSRYGYVTLSLTNGELLKISEIKSDDEQDYSKFSSKTDIKIRNSKTDNYLYLNVNHGRVNIK